MVSAGRHGQCRHVHAARVEDDWVELSAEHLALVHSGDSLEERALHVRARAVRKVVEHDRPARIARRVAP